MWTQSSEHSSPTNSGFYPSIQCLRILLTTNTSHWDSHILHIYGDWFHSCSKLSLLKKGKKIESLFLCSTRFVPLTRLIHLSLIWFIHLSLTRFIHLSPTRFIHLSLHYLISGSDLSIYIHLSLHYLISGSDLSIHKCCYLMLLCVVVKYDWWIL